MTDLVDGPVLAALTILEHEHHDRAGRWLAAQPAFAVTPATEASLLRFLLRLGESPSTALAVLASIRQHPSCEFWPADLSHAALVATDLSGVEHLGTAYLTALAAANGGRLATLDEALAERSPEATALIPA